MSLPGRLQQTAIAGLCVSGILALLTILGWWRRTASAASALAVRLAHLLRHQLVIIA